MTHFTRKKPFLIAMVMALFAFIAILGTFAMTIILLTSIFGDGPYRMNGELVTKSEFLRFLVPFSAVYLAACGFMGTIAWFVHSENPRSRPLLLGYVALPLVAFPLTTFWGAPAASALAGAVPWALIVLVAWLYLYRKDSVVMYYGELERASDDPTFGTESE